MLGGSFLPRLGARVPRDLSSFLQLPLNTFIFRNLPRWSSRIYLGLLGAVYFKLAYKQRASILTALRLCLPAGRGRPAAGRIWPRVRTGIVDHYHEKLLVALKPFKWLRRFILTRVTISGTQELQAAVERGRGVLMITGHYGAVEFLPCVLAFKGLPVTVLVHCKSAGLRRHMERQASRAGARLLDPKSRSVLFQVLEHLAQGRIVITQCDEIDMWRPYGDRRINFLGQSLPLDRSLDIIARKSAATVLFGLVCRQPKGRFQLALKPVSPSRLGTGRPLYSAACLQMLAQEIYAAPHAWYEWKKLGRLLGEQEAGKRADSWILGVPGEVALPHGGGA